MHPGRQRAVKQVAQVYFCSAGLTAGSRPPSAARLPPAHAACFAGVPSTSYPANLALTAPSMRTPRKTPPAQKPTDFQHCFCHSECSAGKSAPEKSAGRHSEDEWQTIYTTAEHPKRLPQCARNMSSIKAWHGFLSFQ